MSRRRAQALGAVGITCGMVLSSMAVSTVATATTGLAGPPTLTHSVQPTYTPGNITRCPSGTTTFINTSDFTPGNQSATYSNGATNFQATVDPTGSLISFTTNSPSFTVYVKGGPAYDTYDYTGTLGHPAYPSDTGLHAPLTRSGKVATVSHYLVCGQPATAKASPTLGTSPSAGGTVGSIVLNDTGTLSDGSAPTGSITFNLYDPSHSDCSGTPAYTTTVPISGNGSYSTSNTIPANLAGRWSWTASYSGDPNNNPASTACGQETVTVAEASPSLTTLPSAGGTVGTVVLNDAAMLSAGYQATGSITFNLYDPSHTDCSGTPAYTTTVPVSGNGSYSTSNTTPANVAGTWSWTASYSGDPNNNPASTACGQETVTVTSTVPQGSCQGSGSISVLVSGTNVISYIPNGNWGGGETGIDVVNVEGNSITDTTIPTGSDVINSCASNSVTGQTVCTANNTHVWILKGIGLDPSVPTNPLTDGGSGTISFSGGSATTTGVSMDPTDNKALIALSIDGVGGFQFLDLATNTFEPPFTTQNPNGEISEDPLIDPVHHLIASASEDNNFELVDVSTSTSPKFFEHTVSGVGGVLDSTSEDCSTGILLAPAEFSSPSQVEIADISNPGTAPEAVFTPGSPGSWTAPEQVQTLTGSFLSAGPSGSSVAQGTHTAVISGEFGGDGLTALALPTTSGAGATPAISDWVTCQIGADPSGNPFFMGFDPHTLVAYQSPNGGHAIALLVNGGATEMVRVDLTKMLDGATVPATGHICDSSTLPTTVASFISLP